MFITDGAMQGETVRNAARELLQEIYEDLPFPEMKRAVEVGGVQKYWDTHTVIPPE